jgi:hypothetical protein
MGKHEHGGAAPGVIGKTYRGLTVLDDLAAHPCTVRESQHRQL